MRIPTVKLVHRRKRDKGTGGPLTLIVNQTQYARNIGTYSKDWEILSVRGGDATDQEVRAVAREEKVDQFRDTDPAEVAKRGDKARHRAQRKLTITTEEPDVGSRQGEDAEEGEAPEVEASEAEASADGEPETVPEETPPIDPEWRKLPWYKRRKEVQRVTGAIPMNMKHAEELVGG